MIKKIDLVRPAGRGLATGINEAAGYAAVAATVSATGYLAAQFGLRPEPFLLGLAYAALGLGLSSFAVRETGTAVVYPTLLAVVGDIAHPIWRTRALGGLSTMARRRIRRRCAAIGAGRRCLRNPSRHLGHCLASSQTGTFVAIRMYETNEARP